MQTLTVFPTRHASLLFAVLFLTTSAHAIVEHKERHLGPTGMFGVTSPKDITIVKVEPGSPADGLIKPGDVITAAGGVPFKDKTRQQLAAAIDLAEATGKLTLTRKDGTIVDIPLPVLGTYSDTAPFDCKKTDAIITRAAEHLMKTRDFGRQELPIALLGLLATGEEKAIEFVKQELHAAPWAQPDIELSLEKYGRTAWSWGYINLLLAEYYLLTKDEHIRPALEAYSVALASGRDAAGLWGHGFAALEMNNGQPHGRLPGYAVMNASSLPCFLSLILADKAGIRHPEVQAAVAQTHGFYSDFIGKGTLPYGVHDPNSRSFNNNGMSGLAALAFATHQNREGSEFFSRMSLASHPTIETGHTGHFFNQLWTGPGVAVAGPDAATAFFNETKWLHTLNRNWNGGFTYDCSGSPGPQYSYRGLSATGAHLVNLSLGRRALVITGRDADASLHLPADEVPKFIALHAIKPADLSDVELLKNLGHLLPKPRLDAIDELRKRGPENDAAIAAMIREGTSNQRHSAIAFFGHGCPPERAIIAIEPLATVLRDPLAGPQLRAAAAISLATHGEKAHPYFNDMLRLIADDTKDDPRGLADQHTGRALTILCPDPYAAGIITNKALFYQAARKLLNHRRAVARNSGAELVRHIPIKDFHHVGDLLRHIIDDEDRTYHSYHNLGPHTAALGIFAEHRIDGGIEAAFRILESDLGKFGFKVRMLMEVMPKYGAAAKPALPRLREINAQGRFAAPWKRMIDAIEAAEGEAKMIPFEQAIKPAGE